MSCSMARTRLPHAYAAVQQAARSLFMRMSSMCGKHESRTSVGYSTPPQSGLRARCYRVRLYRHGADISFWGTFRGAPWVRLELTSLRSNQSYECFCSIVSFGKPGLIKLALICMHVACTHIQHAVSTLTVLPSPILAPSSKSLCPATFR